MKKRNGMQPLLPVAMACERAETIGCHGCTANCLVEEAAMAANHRQDAAGSKDPQKIVVQYLRQPAARILVRIR